MKIRIIIGFIALVICIVFTMRVNAQVSYSVGQPVTLSIDTHAGSTYYWSVYSDVNASISSDASTYQFTSPANSAATTIVFKQSGTYYPLVVEMSADGCSTGRYVPIYIIDNSNTVQFPTSSNTLCYVDALSGISIPMSFSDQSGSALASTQFPITVSYTIDGVAQTPQSITEADQNLSINATQLSGSGSVDQTYSIAITGATDAQNQTIQAQSGHDTYALTLIAQPIISLPQTTAALNLNDQESFVVNGSNTFIYQWQLTAPDGSVSVLSSAAESSGTITFDQAGTYTLQVRARGSNECWSGWQSIEITVTDTSEPEPETGSSATLAINDTNLGWKNETLSGNVLTNDLYGDGTIQLAVTTIPDASTGKLTAFSKTTGAYTFVPASGFVGDAVFEYQLCETKADGTKQCSTAMATIQVLETDLTNPSPAAIDKQFALSQDASVSGNFIDGDINFIKQALLASTVNTSAITGSLQYATDGSFSYQPAASYTGSEAFTYKICDGTLCDWATVSLYVWGSDFDAQSLFAGDRSFYNSGILNGQLDANHRLDGATSYTYSLVSNPADGVVSLNSDGSFSYQPNVGQYGYFTDQFVYKISNQSGSSEATVYISSHIDEPTIIVQSQYTSGYCSSVQLDASKSTGTGTLSYNWSPSTYLSDATSATPIFIPGESTTYTLTLTDELGNTSTRTVQVNVAPQPDVVTDAYVFVQSQSESVMLDATASVGTGLSYNWTSGGSGVIVSGQNTATAEVKGSGKYYLTVTDAYGCMDMDSVIVGVWVQAIDDQASVLVNTYVNINVLRNDIPQGDLDPSSVSIVVPPSSGTANIYTDSVIVYTPNTDFIGEDNFVYRVCNYLNQCDEATVLVIVNEESLFIPNAFTPNSDGYNDYFEIKGLAKYSNVHLRIFTRWGNLVYESANYGNGSGQTGYWNGVANRGVRIGKGEVPAGTYFYILDLGKGNESLSGFIYIDR